MLDIELEPKKKSSIKYGWKDEDKFVIEYYPATLILERSRKIKVYCFFHDNKPVVIKSEMKMFNKLIFKLINAKVTVAPVVGLSKSLPTLNLMP